MSLYQALLTLRSLRGSAHTRANNTSNKVTSQQLFWVCTFPESCLLSRKGTNLAKNICLILVLGYMAVNLLLANVEMNLLWASVFLFLNF